MFDIVQIGMIQRWCLKYLRSIGQWLVMGIPVLCAVLVLQYAVHGTCTNMGLKHPIIMGSRYFTFFYQNNSHNIFIIFVAIFGILNVNCHPLTNYSTFWHKIITNTHNSW